MAVYMPQPATTLSRAIAYMPVNHNAPGPPFAHVRGVLRGVWYVGGWGPVAVDLSIPGRSSLAGWSGGCFVRGTPWRDLLPLSLIGVGRA